MCSTADKLVDYKTKGLNVEEDGEPRVLREYFDLDMDGIEREHEASDMAGRLEWQQRLEPVRLDDAHGIQVSVGFRCAGTHRRPASGCTGRAARRVTSRRVLKGGGERQGERRICGPSQW